MNDKIKVQIFSVKYKELSGGCGCSHKKSSCKGCGEENNCKSCSTGCTKNFEKTAKTVEDAYEKLEKFIKSSDVNNKVQLEFIDLEKINIKEQYKRVWETIDKGFDPPITVIDNIIRYYGGISNDLVYKDVKELLE